MVSWRAKALSNIRYLYKSTKRYLKWGRRVSRRENAMLMR